MVIALLYRRPEWIGGRANRRLDHDLIPHRKQQQRIEFERLVKPEQVQGTDDSLVTPQLLALPGRIVVSVTPTLHSNMESSQRGRNFGAQLP
jgi:hypothetical protein